MADTLRSPCEETFRSPTLTISILLLAASQVTLLPAESVMTIDLALSESSSRIV